ncbi:MAG TPA: alpha-amylase family protein, partial [Thermoleophilaceae bacterium]|nr:alpha-amylase family protein [Thermoleophilaceae bacterium]
MPRACLAIAAVLAALVAVPPAHAREAPDTIVQDDAELLFRSDERVTQSMRHLRSLGVDRVRLNAGWSSIAPDPDSLQRPDLTLSDPDAYPRVNWRRLDRAVRAAHDAGLQVMIDIAFWAPRWATTGNPQGAMGRERWNVDPAAFAEFTAAVVKRYSGNFVPEPDMASTPQSDSPDHQLLEGPLGSLLGGGGPLP